jgi:hypothetical protein
VSDLLKLAEKCERQACDLAVLLHERGDLSSDLPQPARLRARAAELAIIANALRASMSHGEKQPTAIAKEAR